MAVMHLQHSVPCSLSLHHYARCPVLCVQVAAQLKDAPPGTALFHPTSNKPVVEQLKCITLSIKLANLVTGPLIQHIEVGWLTEEQRRASGVGALPGACARQEGAHSLKWPAALCDISGASR